MALARYKSIELTGHASGGPVLLRHPKWADYDQWAELRSRNQDYLTPWEPAWNSGHLTRRAYRSRLNAYSRMVMLETGFPFHIFAGENKNLVGACHITQVRKLPSSSGELGYWVGEEYARRGFARTAISTILPFAFETLGLHRLKAAVQTDNERSVGLLEASGFHHEGTARDYLKVNGVWRDHEIYARLSGD